VLVSGSVSDSDLGEAHPASINWGDGSATETVTLSAGSTGTFSASHVYVDDGAYSTTLKVGDPQCSTSVATSAIAVANTPPIASIAPLPILSRRGVAISINGAATDAGADDLKFTWTFPPSPVAEQRLFRSNGVFPFTALDTISPTFEAGVFAATLVVSDDENAASSATRQFLVSGDERCVETSVKWRLEFSRPSRDPNLLQRYLDVVNALSSIFSESMPAATPAEAFAVYDRSGGGRTRARDDAFAEMLTTWLNVASGALAYDGALQSTTAEIEMILRSSSVDDRGFRDVTDRLSALNREKCK
jgi:hypothetical protein